MTGDAVVVAGAGAPAPPKPTSQQQPPAYAQAKNAYEALWKQHSDTRPMATQAPAGNAAASSSAPPEATAVNARPPAPAATAPSAPPLKLHAFQKLVGDEAFIPESSLTILKRIGAGSFATGEQRVLMTMEDSVLREDSVFVFFLDPLPILLPLPLPLPLPPACSLLHPFFPSPRKTRITLKKKNSRGRVFSVLPFFGRSRSTPNQSFISFSSSRTLTFSTMTSGPDTPLTVRYSVDGNRGNERENESGERVREKEEGKRGGVLLPRHRQMVGRRRRWASSLFLASASSLSSSSSTHRAWAPGCSPSKRRQSAPERPCRSRSRRPKSLLWCPRS